MDLKLVVVMLAFCAKILYCDDYYGVSSRGYTVSESTLTQSQHFCLLNDKYLASVHSQKHNDYLKSLCGDSYCWLGLTITAQGIKWDDDTDIDIGFINKSLCSNINLLQAENATYYGFINTSGNCWDTTTDPSTKFMASCGPKMIDPTNYYWIGNTLIPCIISIIVICCTIYCEIYLIKHFYIKDHTYADQRLIPSMTIKASAIFVVTLANIIFTLFFIYCIMLYVAYKQTEIYPPSSVIDEYYPLLYNQAGYIEGATLACYGLYIPSAYCHVCTNMYMFN